MDILKKFSDGRWRELEEYQTRMASAASRCAHIAASELAMGFDESHAEYRAMLEEISETYHWLSQTLP
jgi:hypothetical protein